MHKAQIDQDKHTQHKRSGHTLRSHPQTWNAYTGSVTDRSPYTTAFILCTVCNYNHPSFCYCGQSDTIVHIRLCAMARNSRLSRPCAEMASYDDLQPFVDGNCPACQMSMYVVGRDGDLRAKEDGKSLIACVCGTGKSTHAASPTMPKRGRLGNL